MKQPSTRTPARRRRLFLPALGLVVIGGVVAVQTLLPTAGLRDDLVTSVEHQTGRSLTVHDISLRILPWPMVVAHDVTLSGTRAAPLFTAHELRARIAFLPLFARHLTLRDVVAQGAALTLERGTDGVANWHFTQPDRPSDTADPSHPAASPTRWDVRVASLQIAGGTVRWDDAAHHLSGHATLDHAAFAGLDGPAPTLDIAGHHQDGGFTLRGQTGALAPLFWPGGAASPDWPVHLIATVTPPRQDADLVRLDGTLDGVGSGTPGGYRVSLSGTLHHLRDLNSLFPRAHLPDVATVGLDVGLHGTADAPHIDHLHLSTGAARFGSVTLAGVEIGAQTPDAPLAVRLDQVAASDAAPAMTVRGTLGTIAGLEAVWQARGLNGLGAPLSVALTGQGAGDTTLHVQGVVGAGATALDLSAHAGHVPLVTGWALDNAVTSARLEAQPDHTLTLSNLKLESRQAIIDGQVALGWSGPRPSVNATVHATRIDVDDMKTPAPPAAEPSTQPRPTGSAATAGSHATDG
ncbi:AsmA family protein, partial [Ameyamaea chiangmaiensis]